MTAVPCLCPSKQRGHSLSIDLVEADAENSSKPKVYRIQKEEPNFSGPSFQWLIVIILEGDSQTKLSLARIINLTADHAELRWTAQA